MYKDKEKISLDNRLSIQIYQKTIVIIVWLMIAAYLPLMISFNTTAFEFVNSTDKSFTQKKRTCA